MYLHIDTLTHFIFLFPPLRRLGYVRVAYVEAFREVELEFLIDDGKEEWREKLATLLREEGIDASGGGGLRTVPFVE
jgi:hypothetical protein